MARITVEDCLEKVENRFHLVRVASKRTRQLLNGKQSTLDWDNDKATVLALREIAAGTITEAMLNEKIIISDNNKVIFKQEEIDAEVSVLIDDELSEEQNDVELKLEDIDSSTQESSVSSNEFSD